MKKSIREIVRRTRGRDTATQIAGSITDPTQIAAIQSLGNDIAGVVTPSVAPNTFVFWAGFNGTNNTSSNPSYSGDTQTTAIGALFAEGVMQ